ncbi:MAG TPA: D-alanyl-D-alanine carboxypeptidase [Stellaceae bacterium]|nr:D-alanyl-D-alanine carboxypeptidase [Stellaceae bacterium]
MSKQQRASGALAPRRRLFGPMGAIAVIAMGLLGSFPAAAHQWHYASRHAAAAGPIFEWILLDAETGQVLGEQNADALTYPASLTKMMTLYLTFEALNQGRITLDQRFYVSPEAASRQPTKLGLTPGDSVSVHDLILGIVTKSANDAASVLAEGLGGTEANFARTMTLKARQLGMDHTWYQNASGLPNPGQRTTARDVARLALALYHRFPREYRYFSTREFDFHGEIVRGHNHLLDWYPGADGIKTGFINASGFNLAASAVRNGHRLIGVIMGGRTWHSRDLQMASLLDQGFAELAGRPATMMVAAAAPLTARAPVATAAAAPPNAAPEAKVATRSTARSLGNIARNALRHLAPVSRAEAAPMAREARSEGEDWAIQIGAFRNETTAERAAHHVAALASLRGKPPQVLAPTRHDKIRLYRTRLTHFTAKAARAVCAELHRKGVACSVVPAGAVTMASR